VTSVVNHSSGLTSDNFFSFFMEGVHFWGGETREKELTSSEMAGPLGGKGDTIHVHRTH
jgi:hypothetical protein